MTIATLHMKQIEERQDNSDKVLHNIWEKQSAHDLDADLEQLIHVVVSKLREATDVVCLSSNVPLPKEILQEIPRLAQRGVRVYLLLNEFDHLYASFINNKAIIRIDEHVVGNILLIDPKLTTKSGYLFSFNSFNSVKNGTHFYFPFDGTQLKEAYHYFLSRFWSSMEEYRDSKMEGNSQQLSPPFDIYPLIDPEGFYYNSRNSHYLRSQLEEIILQANRSLQIGLSKYNELDALYATLYLKAEQGVSITLYTGLHVEHDFLKEFRDNENVVVKAVEHLNNFFVLADNDAGLLLSGTLDGHNEAGISLSPKAVQDFIYRLNQLEPNMWSFRKEIRLGEIQTRKIFIDQFNKQFKEKEIEEFTTVDYGEIVAPTLRAFFEGAHKPGKKQSDELAMTTIHRWKLIPPVLDDNAKQDALYDQWEKETTKLKKYVEQVLEYAKTVGKEKKAFFGSIFGRLFQKDDKVDVEKIIQGLESATIEMDKGSFKWSAADELLKKIEQYTSKLLEQQLELKEKQDYYEKKEKWEQERNRVLKEKQDKEAALKALEHEYSEVESQMNEVAPELLDEISLYKLEIQDLEEKLSLIAVEEQEALSLKKFNDVVHKVCANLDERIKGFQKLKNAEKKKYFTNKVEPYLKGEFDSIGKLDILKSILDSNNIKDGKGKMKYVKKEIATHVELREEIPSDKEDILKQYEELCEEKDKLNHQLTQLEQKGSENKKEEKTKLQKLDKEIQKANQELSQNEKRLEKLGEEFNYSPSSKEAQKLPFSTNFTLNLPKEKLPHVGKLYKVGKTRKLAISNQQQLSAGEEEAVRLQAELVLG